jgi:isoleucyl-tRNA synthetase
MKGFRVERRFGWDCHGLPVETLIEKELGLNSKSDIERYGVAEFNEACRASVLRYVEDWRTVITRLGRWVDIDNDYKTMDPAYMETIWGVIASLWERDLLYEGHYILPYCPRCATVLSNHELNLGGFKEVTDPSITVRFRITGMVPGSPAAQNVEVADFARGAGGAAYLLAWTTTPWTLPSNLALVLGPDIDYVLVQDGTDRYILAESRLAAYYKDPADCRIHWRKKGAELLGICYEALFPYFEEHAQNNAFRTYTGDYVSTEDGTGIVHTAPGFGEDDERILRGTGVPMICPVDAECRFTEEVPDYQGLFVKDADKKIIEYLKIEEKLVKRDQILHAYPHCWRCGNPLIYRAVGSWFVNVEKIKADMLKANGEIYWVPEHIKAGRFGKWLEGARDWAISRNRYWGNPMPLWRCGDCGKTICIGSREELYTLSGKQPEDLHKHYVDQITIPCSAAVSSRNTAQDNASCNGTMTRIPEVLDCWFESGAMPYGQYHYPFENKQFFEEHFPADFISEGLDQTRGWFYTLHVLAAALFKKPAFKNCIVSGLVLASDGKKMSKSQKNYTDPTEVVNNFGADALRLFLIHSAVVKADDLRYNDEGVKEVMKSIIIPLWNAYSFFITYANIDKVEARGLPSDNSGAIGLSNPLDRWILSETEKLVEKTGEALEAYDLYRAVDPILEFINNLNNWYIRRSRRRFWKSADSPDQAETSGSDGPAGSDGPTGSDGKDKTEAYGVLYEALKTLITVTAPFMPFTTDAIWQNLRLESDPLSVHLTDFPEPRKNRRDRNLEFKMMTVQHAVSMGRALRSQYSIKVRQPLKTVELVTGNPEEKNALMEMEDSIREELNVKNVLFRDNEEDLVEYEAKANFRVLGKELGKDMKAVAERIVALNQQEIQNILAGTAQYIKIDERIVEITAEKLDIRRMEKAKLRVLNEGTLTVALDTEITEDLSQEGDVRELIRGVQNARKEAGLEVTDRIVLSIYGSSRLKSAWQVFSDYIADETLAVAVDWGKAAGMIELDAGEEKWFVKIEKN